ncbi:14677_t:CDS:1 [Dentiscutata heterogama]|uniref:14677_t:CDS:1 n=1 Tax=Dentiscutata heterogama TaxID=1316150 RepID=A0ACA9LVT9_9GLOM|nr:14677_t:CDS:1 [Dentiscutata heterogama]
MSKVGVFYTTNGKEICYCTDCRKQVRTKSEQQSIRGINIIYFYLLGIIQQLILDAKGVQTESYFESYKKSIIIFTKKIKQKIFFFKNLTEEYEIPQEYHNRLIDTLLAANLIANEIANIDNDYLDEIYFKINNIPQPDTIYTEIIKYLQSI